MHGPTEPSRAHHQGLHFRGATAPDSPGFSRPERGQHAKAEADIKGGGSDEGQGRNRSAPHQQAARHPKHSPTDEGDLVMQLQGGGPGPVNAVGGVLHDLSHV